MKKKIYLLSPGDQRPAACDACWPMQEKTLLAVEQMFAGKGYETVRVYPAAAATRGHGFIMSQAEGLEVVAQIPKDAPVVDVLSCWAFADHTAGPLANHEGNILLLANFDGTWPGLVAMLNHSATFARMDIGHERAWSETFDDAFFLNAIDAWLATGEISYSTDHELQIGDDDTFPMSAELQQVVETLVEEIRNNPLLLGIADAGSCMGMGNAMFDFGLAAKLSMPVQYLSQAELITRMFAVKDNVALAHFEWLQKSGANFYFGTDDGTELTTGQVIQQMKMYQAMVAMVGHYGLDGIGIPCQKGMVGLGLDAETPEICVASDLVEGVIGNGRRPPVWLPGLDAPFRDGHPIPHGNEGDLGALMPQVLMCKIYEALGMPAETTLHDIRWGREFNGDFVWVLLISGGAPPAHFGGWNQTHIYRQPPMYFPAGGGTCSGVTEAGVFTCARAYQLGQKLFMDISIGDVVELPEEEVRERLQLTTPVWPIANMVIEGLGRNELMTSYMSNHMVIGKGNIAAALAELARALGFQVSLLGTKAMQLVD